MEDEIDLRKYLNVLIRQWKWVVGLALVAALAALAVSLLLPPRYEATALFVVTRPRYQLQFDPMIPSLPVQSQSYRALPELALSDDLVMQVIDVLGGQLQANERSLVSFRSRLSAEAGADPSLIRLSATATDPQKAQTIANTWATLYITYTNNLYQQGAADARFFQTQAAEARAKLESAEQALIDYQARNPVNVINAQLAAKQTALSDYLSAGQGVTLIIQDARSLQQQLGQQNANEPSSLADELSALYLQVDALNSKASVPIQLQIGSGGSLANRTVAEQVALLGTLVKTLQDKSVEIQQQIEAIQPDILALQKEQQTARTDLDRLTRARDVARDTYLALTRKLDETNVAAQDNSGGVQLASWAAVPTERVSPRKGLNMMLGGMLGLVLGVIGAFVVDARKTNARSAVAAPMQTRTM